MSIFLDIDGILNREQDWRVKYSLYTPCIDSLSVLADKLGCHEIILSSTWRACEGWNEPQFYKNLKDKLKARGLTVAGTTPVSGHTRGEEILYYAKRHDCGKYLILDDDPSLFQNTRDLLLYICNHRKGFTDKDIKAAYKTWVNYWKK